MRILLVSFSYTPHASPRAFRWSAIAEHWIPQHEVTVLAGWSPGLPRYEVIAGVRVFRPGGSTVMHRLRSGLATHTLAPAGAVSDQLQSNQPRSSVRWLTHLARALYDRTWKQVYWPDYACLWYRPAVALGKALLSDQAFDVIISSSLPFTGHLVGKALHQHRPLLPWIVDIGDPFALAQGNQLNNHALYAGVNMAVERNVLGGACAIAVTTEATARLYASAFPIMAHKIAVIPPLIANDAMASAARPFTKRSDVTKIVFAGTFYRRIRSPEVLLRIFCQLLREPIGARLQLHLFGALNDCADIIDRYRFQLGSQLVVYGIVTREKAIEAQASADVLLNIGNETSFQLPSKVVEYVGMAKPILNIAGGADDSSVAFLNKYPAALSVVSPDGRDLDEGQMERLVAFLKAPPVVDPQLTHEWTSPFRVEAIAALYEQLFTTAVTGHAQR